MRNLLETLGSVCYGLVAFGCAIYFTYHDKHSMVIIGFLIVSFGVFFIDKLASNISEVQFGKFTFRAEKIVKEIESKSDKMMHEIDVKCDGMMKEAEERHKEMMREIQKKHHGMMKLAEYKGENIQEDKLAATKFFLDQLIYQLTAIVDGEGSNNKTNQEQVDSLVTLLRKITIKEETIKNWLEKAGWYQYVWATYNAIVDSLIRNQNEYGKANEFFYEKRERYPEGGPLDPETLFFLVEKHNVNSFEVEEVLSDFRYYVTEKKHKHSEKWGDGFKGYIQT